MITELDNVDKIVDLDVPTLLQEQIKYPVLTVVRSWIEGIISPDLRAPGIRQPKVLLRYCQELDRILLQEHGRLLCSNEPSETLYEASLGICLRLSPVLAWFRMGHFNELGGHKGASKTFANAKRFFYWPGMFVWICALTTDSLACQNTKPKPKPKPKLLNEVPLEEWPCNIVPFCAIPIDHKGPLHTPSN